MNDPLESDAEAEAATKPPEPLTVRHPASPGAVAIMDAANEALAGAAEVVRVAQGIYEAAEARYAQRLTVALGQDGLRVEYEQIERIECTNAEWAITTKPATS